MTYVLFLQEVFEMAETQLRLQENKLPSIQRSQVYSYFTCKLLNLVSTVVAQALVLKHPYRRIKRIQVM
jgi:hypothetical protein